MGAALVLMSPTSSVGPGLGFLSSVLFGVWLPFLPHLALGSMVSVSDS